MLCPSPSPAPTPLVGMPRAPSQVKMSKTEEEVGACDLAAACRISSACLDCDSSAGEAKRICAALTRSAWHGGRTAQVRPSNVVRLRRLLTPPAPCLLSLAQRQRLQRHREHGGERRHKAQMTMVLLDAPPTRSHTSCPKHALRHISTRPARDQPSPASALSAKPGCSSCAARAIPSADFFPRANRGLSSCRPIIPLAFSCPGPSLPPLLCCHCPPSHVAAADHQVGASAPARCRPRKVSAPHDRM